MPKISESEVQRLRDEGKCLEKRLNERFEKIWDRFQRIDLVNLFKMERLVLQHTFNFRNRCVPVRCVRNRARVFGVGTRYLIYSKLKHSTRLALVFSALSLLFGSDFK